MSTGKGFKNETLVIDQVHHRIHQGVLWTYSGVEQGVADNAFMQLLLRIPSGEAAHIRLNGSVGGDAIGYLWEDPISSDDGTAAIFKNRNRYSTLTNNVLLFTGPTVTDKGTNLMEFYIAAGSKKQASGGEGSAFEEWVLNTGDYLLEIENISGGATSLAIAMDMYVPPEGVPSL